MTAALEGGEWSAARPSRTLPPGKTRHPLYRRLGGPQGRSGRAENLAPHRDSIPDRPACSHSLHRLSYPAHANIKVKNTFHGGNNITCSINGKCRTAATLSTLEKCFCFRYITVNTMHRNYNKYYNNNNNNGLHIFAIAI